MKVIGGTGHRPSKIGGYILPNPTYNYICQQAEKILLQEKPDKVISGMALGFDMWLANIAIKLGIPFIAAVPFMGQDSKWPFESRKIYKILLAKAAEVVIVSEGEYSAKKLQIRNEWIVDHCNLLLACYNNDETGGTANCVKYAEKIGREICIINPKIIER